MAEPTQLQEAIDSAHSCMTGGPFDWGSNGRFAWLYGLVVGWGEVLPEIGRKFNWPASEVARLRRLRKAIEETGYEAVAELFPDDHRLRKVVNHGG